MANKTVGDLFATLQATTTAVTALQNALTPFVDGLEGFTDGIEGSIGVTSDSVATAGGTGTVISNLRRLTTDLDAIKTTLGTISGNVDGLEGFTDGIESLITSLNGFVDGLEGSIGATNATAVTDPTATATLLAVLKGILKVLSQDGIKRIADGLTINGTNTANGAQAPALSTVIDANGYPVLRFVDAAPFAYNSVRDTTKVEVKGNTISEIINNITIAPGALYTLSRQFYGGRVGICLKWTSGAVKHKVYIRPLHSIGGSSLGPNVTLVDNSATGVQEVSLSAVLNSDVDAITIYNAEATEQVIQYIKLTDFAS